MNKPTFAGVTGTTTATRHLAALMSLAFVMSACDSGASSMASAMPTSPTAATGIYTLFGEISEMTEDGPAPLAGALVREKTTGFSSMTGSDGSYTIPRLGAGLRSISITREWYVAESRTVTISGDTQLDIQLDRTTTHTLSGVVFETTAGGRVPLEGVEIYCDSCGSPEGHTFVHTDKDGLYSLAWAADGVHYLLVTKGGYGLFDPTGKLVEEGWTSATVRGDTRLDIELVRR